MAAKTTKEIAEWLCSMGYKDFSSDVVNYTETLALSHLGMTVAGSAMLAKLGFTGNSTILEGHGGFMDLWAGQSDFDLPLGDGFRVTEIGVKKYSCCYLEQRNIDGVLDLIAEHNISWDDVESVEHEINHTVSLYLKYPQPETGEDARFSLEHSTVACFLDKHVFLSSYTDEKAQDPRFREARRKVKVPCIPNGRVVTLPLIVQ